MLILPSHVYGLILIGLSEEGEEERVVVKETALHCNKSPLSLTQKDSAVPRIWGPLATVLY